MGDVHIDHSSGRDVKDESVNPKFYVGHGDGGITCGSALFVGRPGLYVSVDLGSWHRFRGQWFREIRGKVLLTA